MERYEVRIAGFGGQGVVTMGKILGLASAIYEGRNAVSTYSYGPESRGGACRSEVVISDREIYYPRVRQADVFIALSQSAHDAYIKNLRKGGLLIIDPVTVRSPSLRKDLRILEIPAVEIAHRMGGSGKYQNMAILGAFCEITKVLSKQSLEKAINKTIPYAYIDKNLHVFHSGIDFVRNRKEDPRFVGVAP